ncbi:MAG TPA: TolC family protein [Myxococcales bacterium LLY-WYZ-16_1]|nr:TolC family protein [Myxococcales bacterium LLY-WYZ-16_1]
MSGASLAWVLGAVAVAAEPTGALRLSLGEAVELALARNLAMMEARVDAQRTEQDVRDAWSTLYPRIDGSASYNRQFAQLNPFAGSDAANLFFGGASVDQYLLNNEVRQARGQPELSFFEFQNEFFAERAQAERAAGLSLDPSDNPFFVENRFSLDLTLTQVLYDGSAFAALKGIEPLRAAARKALQDEARQLVRDVTEAYYAALLAAARVGVLERRADRVRDEVRETRQRVEQGVRPRYDLLSAEVDLANTETELLRAENDAASALDRIRVLVGIRENLAITLQDSLTAPNPGERMQPDLAEALATARADRPDLARLELQERVADVETRVQFGNLVPRFEAFFTLGFIGQVPDNRTSVFQSQASLDLLGDGDAIDPGTPYDPTAFASQNRGFFDGSYWGPDIQGGVRMSWKIFDGFAQYAQLERNRLQVRRLRFRRWNAEISVQTEVEQEVRDLRTAAKQLELQEKNVQRAELNYDHASARVEEGVSSVSELRDANDQLDESRLNQLQAVHDYRVAEVAYLVAIGRPPFVPSELSAELPDEDRDRDRRAEGK